LSPRTDDRMQVFWKTGKVWKTDKVWKKAKFGKNTVWRGYVGFDQLNLKDDMCARQVKKLSQVS
jgi:hypothetical protein